MEEIIPYESEIFYHPLGLRIWEERHYFVNEVLERFNVKKVNYINYLLIN